MLTNYSLQYTSSWYILRWRRACWPNIVLGIFKKCPSLCLFFSLLLYFNCFHANFCPFYPRRPSPSGILFFDIYSQTWYNTTLWVWALVEMFCHLYLTALSVTLHRGLLRPARSCHYCKQQADSPVLAVFNPVCTDGWVSQASADFLTWCGEVSACRWDKTKK